jgi:hypothetical protein
MDPSVADAGGSFVSMQLTGCVSGAAEKVSKKTAIMFYDGPARTSTNPDIPGITDIFEDSRAMEVHYEFLAPNQNNAVKVWGNSGAKESTDNLTAVLDKLMDATVYAASKCQAPTGTNKETIWTTTARTLLQKIDEIKVKLGAITRVTQPEESQEPRQKRVKLEQTLAANNTAGAAETNVIDAADATAAGASKQKLLASPTTATSPGMNGKKTVLVRTESLERKKTEAKKNPMAKTYGKGKGKATTAAAAAAAAAAADDDDDYVETAECRRGKRVRTKKKMP